jgi:hypothetical protein
MRTCTSRILSTSGIGCLFGSALPLLFGGCEPLSGEILGDFVLDFARGALAAWLL